MNQKFDMTVKLSPEQVREAVAKYIQEEIGELKVTASDVKLEIGTEYEDRPCGSSYPVFKYAEAKISKSEQLL